MNHDKNNDDLEERLARRRPAEPPPDLMRRLRAAEPPPARARYSWQRWVDSLPLSLSSWLLRPWPLAYAGLAAAWAMILALRLLTLPLLPEPAERFSTARADTPASNAVTLAGNSPAESAFLFARNYYSEDLWP